MRRAVLKEYMVVRLGDHTAERHSRAVIHRAKHGIRPILDAGGRLSILELIPVNPAAEVAHNIGMIQLCQDLEFR